jgi:ABC-type amino acid transport substrate-binding protein
MFKRAESSKTVEDIKVQPWASGYVLAQEKKNTVLFSTTRTQTRENLFKWADPINPTRVSVVTKKDRNIKISSFDDFAAYKIGAARQDIGELLLKKNGKPSAYAIIRTTA